MSDSSAKSAPLVSTLAVFVGFALFYVVLHYVYVPRLTGVFTDDGVHTAQVRKENLAKLHEKQAKQAASYAWVDKAHGVVQLPIDRAVELTLERYATKK